MEKIVTNYKGCEISTCDLNLQQHNAAVELVTKNPITTNYALKEVDREMVNVWIADAHSEGRDEYAEFLRDALANNKEIYTLVDELGGFSQEIGEVVIDGDIEEDAHQSFIDDEVKLALDLYRTDDSGFGIWLSDNVGGSGIEVEANTPQEVAKKIADYIADYFYQN